MDTKVKKWLYRGGRPGRLANLINSFWAAIHSLGVMPDYMVTMEVRGRRSGRLIRLPLAMLAVGDERYLVSMLGADAEWVRNVRAARGQATLVHGRRRQVRLEDVPVELRAPLLKAYLQLAPGARAHIPVDKDAPVAAFEQVAAQFPVFRVVPA